MSRLRGFSGNPIGACCFTTCSLLTDNDALSRVVCASKLEVSTWET